MTPTVHCPCCDRSLGKIHPDGNFQIDCPACSKTFGVVYGKVSGWQSQGETVFYLSPKLPRLHKRRYEFRITTPGRSLKILKFSLPFREDHIPVYPGDRISVLYSVWNQGLKKLIAVNNHTRGQRYPLASPLPSRGYWLATQGVVAAIALFAILSSNISGFAPWMGAIVLLSYAKLVHVAELSTPELDRRNPAEARLLDERDLLLQKCALAQRVEEVGQETRSHEELIQRLRSLRKKMLTFNSTLYETRVGQIESAIRLLQRRIQQNHLLTEQYAQTTQMIEIELETAYLTEQLPEIEDFSHTIGQRLQELRAIEEHNRRLQFQLEANDEVRRLSLE
jgi:ubiquinone biosynthesis protein UbiJ